jgi:hypothetical protein
VLKIKQKEGTSLDSPRCKVASSLKRLSISLYRGLEVHKTSGNSPITLKIIALTNITVIKTSVSVVYLLVYYSIYYPPLLCTSCGSSKICLPPIYNPIGEFQVKLGALFTVYHWDGQTICLFQAWRVLTTRGI